MENSEQQIAFIKNIFVYPDKYDLYLMDKRLVVINTRSQTVAGFGLIPELIGEGITKINESRKKEKMKNLTLDEMLAKDKKKSFTIPYEDIQNVKVYKPKYGWSNWKLEIKSIKLQKTFYLKKEQFEQLSKLLPNISALNGKIS